jgi:hypothetical protein
MMVIKPEKEEGDARYVFEFLGMKDGEIVNGDSVTVGMCASGECLSFFRRMLMECSDGQKGTIRFYANIQQAGKRPLE